MKYLYIILIVTLFTPLAQAQDWLAGSNGNFASEALDIAVDGNGNSVVIGYFSGQLQFNDSSIQASSGFSDAFLAKYSSTGQLLWLKKFGGNQIDRGQKVAIDNSNNIYITGYFAGSMQMGATTLNSNGGSRDIFTAKLTTNGGVTWARSDGGSDEEIPYGIAVDGTGNVIITGKFTGNTTIGSTSYSSQINPANGSPSADIFIAKFSTAGAPAWTKKGNSREDDMGIAVTCDNANNIYVTGQYSDTMNFIGQTINNQVINAGYVAKLTVNGDLTWFDKLGATQTYASAIKINSNNEIYTTGNFLGTMFIQANAVTNQLTSPYVKKIFLIKLGTATGNYIWGRAQGSDSDLTSRGLTIDNAQNVFICGDFRCNFDEYRDSTDTGLWNTVGFRDIFVSKFGPGGGMIWNRQSGGKREDLCYALANGGNDKPIFAGSFENDLFIPTDVYNLTNLSASPNNIVFNGAGAGVGFLQYSILGDLSKNVFVGKVNDVTNPNYYYYQPGGGMGVPYDSIPPDLYPQQDTVEFCNAMYLAFQQHADPYVGPDFDFSWSADNLDDDPYLYVAHTNEMVTVTSISIDGCYTFHDTIITIAHQSPLLPLMTDDHGYNTNSPVSYTNIQLCIPDTALVSFSNLCNQCTLQINYYNSPFHTGLTPFEVTDEGDYVVIVMNEFGCTSQSVFAVIHDTVVDYDSIYPVIVMLNADNFDDSISVCENESIQYIVIDTITNPSGTNTVYSTPFIYEQFLSPDVLPNMNVGIHSCTIVPDTTGWYVINYVAYVGYDNACGTDTIQYHVSDSFYITVFDNPVTNLTLISDSPICPGDSCYISVSQTMPGGVWTGGNNIVWQSTDGDSILVSQIGYYSYAGATTDTVTGCSASFTVGTFVSNKQAPLIQMYPFDGLICPNATVTLSVIPAGTYNWIGPDGSSLGSNASLDVATAGLYYCIYTDPEGCSFTLEQVEISEYIIPSLAFSPVNVFCDSSDIELIPVYNGVAAITWYAPIVSVENTVFVNQPGTYYCEIYQCGTATLDSVTLSDGQFTPFITATDTLICPGQTTTITTNPGMLSYEWNNGQFLGNTFTTNQPGTVTVTLINALGCEQTVSINIGLENIPPAPNQPDQTLCQGQTVVLTDNSGFTTAWYTDLNDTIPNVIGSTYTIPTISTTQTLYVSHPHPLCAFNLDTITLSVIPYITTPAIIGNAVLCENEDLFLATDSNSVNTIVWTLNGDTLSTSPTVSVPYTSFTQNGTIYLSVSNDCFTQTSSTPLTLIGEYPLELNAYEMSACDYLTISLYGINGFSGEIYWQNGGDSVTGNPLIIAAGNFEDSVFTAYGIDDDGCVTLPTSVLVTFEDCTPRPPNVITSNGDGTNDYFIIPNAELMKDNYLVIVNRWGNVLFEMENYDNSFSGNEWSEGVYFYQFYPDGKDGQRPAVHGFFHLYH
jgi:hypothetical protein